MVTALGFRLYGIQASLWLDEILTHKRANQALNDVIVSATYPLSNILAYFSLKLGDTESMLRLPNLIAGLLSIIIIYCVCRVALSARIGLIACFMMTFSAYHIEYSQDARYYSLMIFFGLCALWAAYGYTVRGGWAYIILFIGSIACGLMNQLVFIPYAFAICATVAVLILTQRKCTRKEKYSKIVLLIMMAFISTIPLLLAVLHYQDAHSAQKFLLPIQEREGHNYYRLTIMQYLNVFTDYYSGFFALYPVWVKSLVFAIAAVGVYAAYMINRTFAILIIGIAILNPFPSFFIKVSAPYYPRYFISQFPIILIMYSCGLEFVARKVAICLSNLRGIKLDTSKRSIRYITIGGIVVGLSCLVPGIYPALKHYYSWGIEDKDWKGFAERIGMEMTKDDIIVYVTPNESKDAWKYLSREPLEFYLNRLAIPGRPSFTPTTSIGIYSLADFLSRLKVVARQNPLSTIWLVMPSSGRNSLDSSMKSIYRLIKSSPKIDLRVLGRPTENLIQGSDFSDKRISEVILNDENISLIESSMAFRKGQSLEIKNLKPRSTHIAFPIKKKQGSGNVFNSNLTYTISLWVKTNNIRQYKWGASTGRLALAGVDESGNKFWRDIRWWEGSSEWNRYSFTLNPATDRELSDLKDATIYIGIYGGTGTMLVDNIQVEAQSSPTPFVDGVRLPHDEALIQIDRKFSADAKAGK